MNEQEYRKEPENKMNLKQKLVEIRKSVEYLQKTERGNQGAMYVDPAVILQKIRSGMDKYGVLLYPEMSEPIIEMIDAPTSKNPNNKGYLSKNNVVYVWSDSETDSEIRVPWFATGSHLQDPAMAFGGATTYSERYFLLKFFQIPTSKDDPEYFAEKTAVIEYITEEQIANIQALIEETKTDVAKFMNHYKITNLAQIPTKYYAQVVSALEAKRENT